MTSLSHRFYTYECNRGKCSRLKGKRAYVANLRYPVNWLIHIADNGVECSDLGNDCKKTETNVIVTDKITFEVDRPNTRFSTARYAVYDTKLQEDKESMRLLLCSKGDKKVIREFMKTLNKEYPLECKHLGMLFDTLRMAAFEYASDVYIVEEVISVDSMKETDYMGNMYLRLFKQMQAEKRFAVAFISYIVPDARVQFMVIGALITVNGKCFVMDVTDGFSDTDMYIEELEKFVGTYIDESFTFLFRGTPLISSTGLHTRQMRGSAVAAFVNMLIINLVSTTEFSDRVENENEERVYMIQEFIRKNAHLKLQLEDDVVITYMDYEAIKFVRFGSEMAREVVLLKSYITTHVDLWMEDKTERLKLGEDIHVTFDCEDVVTARSNDIRVKYHTDSIYDKDADAEVRYSFVGLCPFSTRGQEIKWKQERKMIGASYYSIADDSAENDASALNWSNTEKTVVAIIPEPARDYISAFPTVPLRHTRSELPNFEKRHLAVDLLKFRNADKHVITDPKEMSEYILQTNDIRELSVSKPSYEKFSKTRGKARFDDMNISTIGENESRPIVDIFKEHGIEDHHVKYIPYKHGESAGQVANFLKIAAKRNIGKGLLGAKKMWKKWVPPIPKPDESAVKEIEPPEPAPAPAPTPMSPRVAPPPSAKVEVGRSYGEAAAEAAKKVGDFAMNAGANAAVVAKKAALEKANELSKKFDENVDSLMNSKVMEELKANNPKTLKESEVIVVCRQNIKRWDGDSLCAEELWVYPRDEATLTGRMENDGYGLPLKKHEGDQEFDPLTFVVPSNATMEDFTETKYEKKMEVRGVKAKYLWSYVDMATSYTRWKTNWAQSEKGEETKAIANERFDMLTEHIRNEMKAEVKKNPMLVNDIKIMGNDFGLKWETCKPDGTMTELINPGLKTLIETRAPRNAQIVVLTREQLKANGGAYFQVSNYIKAKGALWKPTFDPKDEKAKKVRYAYPNSVRQKAEQNERDIDALSNTLKNIERIVKRYRVNSITEVRSEVNKEKVKTHKEEQDALQKADVENAEMRKRPNGDNLYAGVVQQIKEQFEMKLRDLDDELNYLDYVGTVAEGQDTIADIRRSMTTAIKDKENYLSKLSPRNLRVDQAIIICRSSLLPIDISDGMSTCREELWVYEKKEISQFAAEAFKTLTETEQDAVNDSWFPAPESFESADQKKNVIYAVDCFCKRKESLSSFMRRAKYDRAMRQRCSKEISVIDRNYFTKDALRGSSEFKAFIKAPHYKSIAVPKYTWVLREKDGINENFPTIDTGIDIDKLKELINEKYQMFQQQGYIDMTDAEFKAAKIPRDWDQWQHNFKIDCKADSSKEWTMSGNVCKFMEDDLIMNRIFQNFTRNYMLFAEDDSNIGVCFKHYNMARRILDHEEKETNLIKGQFERLKDVTRGLVLVARIQSLLKAKDSKTIQFSDLIVEVDKELEMYAKQREKHYFKWSKKTEELNLEKLLEELNAYNASGQSPQEIITERVSAYTEKIMQFEGAYGQPMKVVWDTHIKDNAQLMARLGESADIAVSIQEYPDPKKIAESYDPNFLRKVMLIIEFLEQQQFERLSTAKAMYEFFSGTYKDEAGASMGPISVDGKRLQTFNDFPEGPEHPALIFDGYKLWDCQSKPEHDLLVIPFSDETCALFKGISKISNIIGDHIVKADTKLDMEFFSSIDVVGLDSEPDNDPAIPPGPDYEPKPDPIKIPLAPDMKVSPFAAKEMRVAFWAGMRGKNNKDAVENLVSVMNEGKLLTPTTTSPMLSFEKQEFISSMLPAYITNDSFKGYRVNVVSKDEFLVVTLTSGEAPDPTAKDFFGRKDKYPQGAYDPQYIADKANYELKSKKEYKFPSKIILARFKDAKKKLETFKADQLALEKEMEKQQVKKAEEQRKKAEEQRKKMEKMGQKRSENPIYYRGPPGSQRVKYRSAPSSQSAVAEGAADADEAGAPAGEAGAPAGGAPSEDYGPSMNEATDDPDDENVLIREFDPGALDGGGKGYSYTVSNVEPYLGGKVQFHRVKRASGNGAPSSPILQEIPNIPIPIKDFNTYRDRLKNIPSIPEPGRINKMFGKLTGWGWRTPTTPTPPPDNKTFSCLKHAIVFSTTDAVDMGFDASPLTLKESEVVVVCPESTSIWSPHERCGRKLWVFPIDHVYRLAHAAMVSIRSKSEEVLSEIDVPSPEGYECFRGVTCRSGAKPRSRGKIKDKMFAKIGMNDLEENQDLIRLRLEEKKMMIACLATNGESDYGEHLMDKQADDPIQKNLIAFIVKCFKNKLIGPSRGNSKQNVGRAYTRFTPESVRRVIFKTGRWAVWGVKFIYKNPKMIMMVGVAVKIIRILVCMWMQGVKYDQCVMFGKILLKRLFGPLSLVYQVAENFLSSIICIAGAVFAIMTAQGKTLADFMKKCSGVVQKIINTLTETLNWLVQQFFALTSITDLFGKLNSIFGSESSQASNAMANIQAMIDNPAQEVIKYVVIGIVVKNPDLILDWVASFTTCAPSYGIIKNFIDEVTGGMIIKPLGHYYKILTERFVDGMLFINNMRMVIDLLTTTVNYIRCWWKVLVSYRGQTLCENDPTCDQNNELNKDPMFAVWNNNNEEKKQENTGWGESGMSYVKGAFGYSSTIYTDESQAKQSKLRAMHFGADFNHFVGAEPTRTWNEAEKKWEIKRNDNEKDQKIWNRNAQTGELERMTNEEIDSERKQSKLMAVCCPETAVIAEMLKSQRNYDEVDFAVQKAEAEISRLCVFKEELAEEAQKQMTEEAVDRMPNGMKGMMFRMAKKKMGIASSCQEARAMLTEAKEQQSKVYQGDAKYTPTGQTISSANQTDSSSLSSLIVSN